MMRIVPRDKELLRWINAHGFVTIKHIAEKLNTAKVTAYIRMKKLVDAGYVYHEHIFFGEAGLYRVSHKGVELSGSALPPLRNVPRGTYYHDVLVTALSLQLSRRHSSQFITERELRHNDNQEVFGKLGHTADGVLLMNDQRIAIEVELSKKSKRRMMTIMQHYLKNFEMKEVWYFCGNSEVRRLVESFTKDKNFFRLFDLRDFVKPDNCEVVNGTSANINAA